MTHTQTQGADGAGTKTAGQIAFQAFRDLNGKGLAALWCTVPGHERVGWDRAAAVTLRTACEPWSFGIGEPPEYGTPLHGVFVAGMLYTERLLANLLGVSDYEGGDGSEDFDADATMSLCNILAGAGLYDKDEGRVNAPAPAATPGVPDSLREALEFYADDKNYYRGGALDPNDSYFEGSSRAVAAIALIAAQPAGQAGDAGADVAEWKERLERAFFDAGGFYGQMIEYAARTALPVLLAALAARPEAPSDAGWSENPIDSAIGTAAQAIEYAIGIDDHYDRLEFLKAWSEGDLKEWPEFAVAIHGNSPTPPSDPAPSGQAEG